jgi:signal transduction histidine kinase
MENMRIQPTILIIDDEPDNFDVLDALLDSEDYELSYVTNGQQALDLLTHFLPDVVLLDVMMPQMNGIEFCQKFKSDLRWKHIPVIMVTALTAKEDLSQCLVAGADDFISKPVNGMELRARIRSMLRIKKQYDTLQETLQLREDLSNMLVHDLRNPLTAILLSAEILQIKEFSPAHQQQRTNQILTSGQQLRSMIDSLLLTAKLDAGKMILQRTDIDLLELISLAILDIQTLVLQKQLKIVSNLPISTYIVNLDMNLFRRVLDNLLYNAIKFAPHESEIILSVDCPEKGRVRIQIADFGPGVKEELRQTIFEKYEVGTMIKGISQMGLGLAFCKMSVEAHGGNISVADNQPQGSVFTITI